MGIFGTKALAGTQFSVVALMSMVELPGWIFRAVRRIDGGDMVLCAVCFDGSYDLSQCEYFYAYIFFKK